MSVVGSPSRAAGRGGAGAPRGHSCRLVGRVKLAFSTLACPAWSLDQVVEAAVEYGYQGVELRLIDGELIDAGLPIVALDTSVRIAAAPDARSVLDELVPMLELASEWESAVVRVFGGEWD